MESLQKASHADHLHQQRQLHQSVWCGVCQNRELLTAKFMKQVETTWFWTIIRSPRSSTTKLRDLISLLRHFPRFVAGWRNFTFNDVMHDLATRADNWQPANLNTSIIMSPWQRNDIRNVEASCKTFDVVYSLYVRVSLLLWLLRRCRLRRRRVRELYPHRVWTLASLRE